MPLSSKILLTTSEAPKASTDKQLAYCGTWHLVWGAGQQGAAVAITVCSDGAFTRGVRTFACHFFVMLMPLYLA